MKKYALFAWIFLSVSTVEAQEGGISSEMLNRIKQSYQPTPEMKAIRNALGANSIDQLALTL